jgi:hypothetical protein
METVKQNFLLINVLNVEVIIVVFLLQVLRKILEQS